MKKFALLILVFTLSGCSWLNKPHLYGNSSCGKGKTAYVYVNGTAAICLNESSVAYIVCARELGIISDEKSRKADGSVAAPISGVNIKASAGFEDELKVLYASEGMLAEARARAIQTCISIYENYK